MTVLLRFVWGTKVCLIGWNAYRACRGEDAHPFICFLSVSYFVVLALATFCSWKSLPTPKQLDAMETDYLYRLEEGLSVGSEKPE